MKQLLLADSSVSLVESLDSSCGVHKLLCTCEEWVAGRADFNCEVLCCCLCLDHVATRAADFLKLVIWVDALFHLVFSLYVCLLSQTRNFSLWSLAEYSSCRGTPYCCLFSSFCQLSLWTCRYRQGCRRKNGAGRSWPVWSHPTGGHPFLFQTS